MTKNAYPRWLPLLLGFLGATGPLSTDMYLPAFPAIEAEYHLPLGGAQITLAAWFLGLAIGQITQGSLSDRFGRRGPLTISTALYTLANIGCAMAPDIHTLTWMRLIAAMAGSASLVIPTAIVRDLASGHAAATMTSKLILVRGVAPIIAPTLGGLMLEFASWHAIFWFAAVYGGVCWLLVMWKMPDTLPPEARVRLDFTGMAVRYRDILVEPAFLTHALMNGAAMFALFAFLGGSPGVFIDGLHLTPRIYALVFSACAACYVLCSQFNPSTLARFGSNTVLVSSARVFFAAVSVLLLISLAATPLLITIAWWALMPPVMLMMGCMGFLLPNTIVGGLHRHSAHAGSASALMGMVGFCLGAVSGLLAGDLSDGTPRGMAALMLTGGVVVLIADHQRRKLLSKA